MYFKLAFRNAIRSSKDYLLYMITLTVLITIMIISNTISEIGGLAGFQASSLPILIVIIISLLLNYINKFILTQRSKEFGTYTLLGMEKKKLSNMFFIEFLFLGVVCLLFSLLISVMIFCLLYYLLDFIQIVAISEVATAFFNSSIYFIIIEVISLFCIKKQISHLEINQLITSKRCNQNFKSAKHTKKWLGLCIISFTTFVALIIAIVALPEDSGMMLISVIIVPVILFIISFYKTLFCYLHFKRRKDLHILQKNDKLFVLADLLSTVNSNIALNSILCICLLFSSISFIFGMTMLQTKISIMPQIEQQWMAFLQISICIIFIVIYFSILSVQQITDIRKNTNSLSLLEYLGRTQHTLNKLIVTQICIKFGLPAIPCILMIAISMPLINYKFTLYTNTLVIPISVILFVILFAVLFIIYFLSVYKASKLKP